jgi:hypothetical protein
MLLDDYRANRRRSLDSAEHCLTHLKLFFACIKEAARKLAKWARRP